MMRTPCGSQGFFITGGLACPLQSERMAAMPDISPPSTPRAEAFEAMSRAAGHASFTLPPPPPARRAGFWARRWRLMLALALLGTAGVALLQQQLTFSTEHAVISGVTLPLRTPIAGEVATINARAGEVMVAGLAFARIENARADRGRLVDWRTERDRARDEAAALAGQMAALERLAAEIRARGQDHRDFSAEHLDAQLREIAELREAALARAQRTAQDAARAVELARAGHGTQAGRERAEAEREAARRETAALTTRMALLERQAVAAGQGIFTELGHIGAGYAEQRLDEIALRRAELARLESFQQAALRRAEQRLQEEEAQYAWEREATLVPPASQTVWRLRAQPGQRVAPGEVLAELVDCRNIFLLAAVPQSALPSLPRGTSARLRLAGEQREWPGMVVGRLGEGVVREADNLAALPSRPVAPSALVKIALEPLPEGTPCPVGRVGRVLFERRGGLFAAR